MIGRVHVQAYNVAHFLDQQRIRRQFEGVGTMRLQAEGPPNTANSHAAEPSGFGHAARAPMRFSAGRAFQGLNDDPLDLGIAYLAGRSRSRFVIESFQTGLQKAGAPFSHHARRDPHFPRHGFVVESFGAGQHPARVAPSVTDCVLDGPAIAADRVPRRSKSEPAWVAQFASKPPTAWMHPELN